MLSSRSSSSRTLRLLSSAGRRAAARLTRNVRPAAPTARPCDFEPLEDRRLLSVTLASIGMGGAAGNGNSGESSISANGRFVVFSSTANDLVAGDTNNASDIFRYDLVNRTIELVSVRPDGAPATGGSFEPSISADGRFVGFRSEAPDVTNNDGQTSSDIFLRDMQTGVTRLVSVRADGAAPGNGESRETFVSADGRYVAFSSFATNLVDGDGNGRTDAFVRDMGTNKTVAVSLNGAGVTGNERSLDPAVAVGADGRVFVSFRSFASDLVANDPNGKVDVFRRVLNGDLTGGQTALVSVNTSGVSGNGDSTSNSISSNGRFVVFSSTSSDLAGGDSNNNADVFLRDMDAGTTKLLSTNRAGTASANGASGEPSVSTDGNFAAYTSTASNIVDGDTNGKDDIFFTDLRTGLTRLLSVNTAGAPGNGRSFDPFVSANGNFVAFTSSASDLANGAGAFDDVFAASTDTGEQGPSNPPGGGGGGDPTPPPVEAGQPPTFALSPFNVPPTTGAADYTFRVNYEDTSGINRTALGNIEVVTPSGAVLPATFVKVAGTGTKARATYRISAPNGTWTANDNGNYTVRATANAVQDGVGNAITGGTTLGTLAVAVAPPESANLNGTINAALPPSLIAGGKNKAKVSLSLLNQGQAAVNGPVTTQLFVSADDEIDEDDVQIASTTTKLKLANNGKGKAVKFKLNFPASITDDTYRILARIDSGNGVVETSEFDNIVVSPNTVVVARPFVDLEATAPTLTAKTLTAGAKATGTVTLKNNGNSVANKPISINVIGRPTNGGADVTLGTATAKVNLKAGATKVTKLKLTLASGVSAANYTLVMVVDPANALGDTNTTNNTAVGPAITLV